MLTMFSAHGNDLVGKADDIISERRYNCGKKKTLNEQETSIVPVESWS